MRTRWAWLLLAGASTAAGAQDLTNHRIHGAGMAAPSVPALVAGHGNGGFPVSTASPEAQAFFSNGMELAAAFEHRAAKAAFAEAVRLDPQCVMCAWGAAWAAGPTINYSLEGEELAAAQKLAALAQLLARAQGSVLDRQLADAIVRRYAKGGGGGTKGDRAFFAAMTRIAASQPADDALQTLAADAALNTIAEEDDDEQAAAKAIAAMRLLSPVLARSPDYTPAIHLYIHASEIAHVPGHAEAYADRLGRLAPRSQHLVHMPSHTFYWVGRYRDAATVNLQAVNISVANAAKGASGAPAQDDFSQRYHTHNVNFGLGGALIAGDKETGLAIARPLVAETLKPDSKTSKVLGGVGLIALGLFAPDELLAMSQPTSKTMADFWHYARGEALALRGDAAGVRVEEKAMRLVPELPSTVPPRFAAILGTTFQIAHAILLGRAAMIDKDYPAAIAAFEKAAALEEGKEYSRMSDPPNWWYPVRRSLAEARLAAGDSAGARADAAATLVRRPKEPGILALLAQIERTAPR